MPHQVERSEYLAHSGRKLATIKKFQCYIHTPSSKCLGDARVEQSPAYKQLRQQSGRLQGKAALLGAIFWRLSMGGGAVPPRRQTFCSAACVHEYKIRSNGSYMRDCVYKRDHGQCSVCGVDTRLVARAIRACETEEAASAARLAYNVPPSRKIWKRKTWWCAFRR